MKRLNLLNKEFHSTNRQQFLDEMLPNSVAIFYSNDNYIISADANHLFYQNPDLYYLSGIDQEDTILVLYKAESKENNSEILFIKKTSELIRIWEGNKYSMEEAHEISGISKVLWNNTFDSTLKNLIFNSQNIYINLNEHERAHFDSDYKDYREALALKEKFPLHTYIRSAPIMSKLRTTKKNIEIELMQKASNVTIDSFKWLLSNMKNMEYEHEIESELTYFFNKNRCTHAYNPIIASGANSCILHYNDNDKKLDKTDVILLDYGANMSNYCSDMTRTIPIGGKFSKRQKEIYNACLNVFKMVKQIANTSLSLSELKKESIKFMSSELKKINLISNDNETSIYFPHGIGHFIGLNVHDIGNANTKMSENSIITNEPGIYILAEKIGIRIENNLVIKNGHNIDLFETCPIEAEEIEDLMN